MKRWMVTATTVLATVLVLAFLGGGAFLYFKYAPSKEWADQNAWYDAEGDEMAVFLNHDQEEGIQGRYIDGQAYLPLVWVTDVLNEKFYWDEENEQLIYTLPEEIVYADAASLGSNGKPLFVQQEDQVWLMTELVTGYTDIRIRSYSEGEAKRVFVDTLWEPQQMAVLKKDGHVRVRGGVKSAILTDVEEAASVEVLEQLENWCKVQTEDGHVGYIQSRVLRLEGETVPPISTFEAPEYTSISLEEPIVMVWHQVMTKAANGTLEELLADTKGVNVVAPTWFMLTENDGSYHSLADQSYVDKVHAKGAQLWAVVDNFNMGTNVQSEVLFSSTAARQKLIASLVNEVKAYGIDGINLDIEGIKPEAGPHYVQFIRELSVDCRKNGIILSVDSYVPSAYTAFYNRAEQGRVADYVVIMGYDEHYAGGEAGSVASIGYERKGIEDTLKEVPREKVISAIPFYTRVWKESDDGKVKTSEAMGIEKASSWVKENNVELYWQEESGQYYGETRKDDVTYSVWMEEERSIGLKMDLIRENRLAGVACWKLGFEPESIWDVVKLP